MAAAASAREQHARHAGTHPVTRGRKKTLGSYWGSLPNTPQQRDPRSLEYDTRLASHRRQFSTAFAGVQDKAAINRAHSKDPPKAHWGPGKE